LKAYGIYVLYNAYLKKRIYYNYDNYDNVVNVVNFYLIDDSLRHLTTFYDKLRQTIMGAQDPFDPPSNTLLNDLAISTGMFFVRL
jgi:hypothetical protein